MSRCAVVSGAAVAITHMQTVVVLTCRPCCTHMQPFVALTCRPLLALRSQRMEVKVLVSGSPLMAMIVRNLGKVKLRLGLGVRI